MNSEHHYRCDLCGHQRHEVIYKLYGKNIVACVGCRLISYFPLPDVGELQALYDSKDYLANPYFEDHDECANTHNEQIEKAVNFASEQLAGGDIILDVGCGRGTFLGLCREKGLHVEGLEISREAAQLLQQKFDFPIHLGVFEDYPFADATYDMITAFDVLEHTKSPKVFLEKAHAALKPGGYLVFSTVNINNVLDGVGNFLSKLHFKKPIMKLYPPYHLYYFDENTLERYLKAGRFQALNIIQENYDCLASVAALERAVLKTIYFMHDLTGHKTNFYVYAKKI